jgi:hypothetical protein
MTSKISRCRICGEFSQSKRQLREHINMNHRITNSKMAMIISEITTTKPNAVKKVLTKNIVEI